MSVVIAGKGLRARECSDSIMQQERFRARRATRLARLSGISVKRLDDKSRDWRVFVRGARPDAAIVVMELSARLRCLRNLHLDEEMAPRERRLDEEPRGVFDRTLDPELPDERLS